MAITREGGRLAGLQAGLDMMQQNVQNLDAMRRYKDQQSRLEKEEERQRKADERQAEIDKEAKIELTRKRQKEDENEKRTKTLQQREDENYARDLEE